jgi:hypothetical protein
MGAIITLSESYPLTLIPSPIGRGTREELSGLFPSPPGRRVRDEGCFSNIFSIRERYIPYKLYYVN